MKIVTIPTGFILYRGSYEESALAPGYINRAPNYMGNRPYYFIYNNGNNNALNLTNRAYGQVTVMRTIKPLHLLNLGDSDTVVHLMSLTNNDTVLKSIKKSYRVSNSPLVTRSSKLNYDVKVANFICSLGYDGFWTPKLKQKYGNKKFHQEIVLCHPRSCLRVVKVEQPSRPPSVAPKMLRRMLVSNSPRPVRRFNFNFDDI